MSKVTQINESAWEQEVLQANTPVLVDFFATWCPPCKILGATLDSIVDDYTDKVKIVKINAEEAPGLSVQFGIRTVPTMVLINDSKIVETVSGALPPETIRQKLDQLASATV